MYYIVDEVTRKEIWVKGIGGSRRNICSVWALSGPWQGVNFSIYDPLTWHPFQNSTFPFDTARPILGLGGRGPFPRAHDNCKRVHQKILLMRNIHEAYV